MKVFAKKGATTTTPATREDILAELEAAIADYRNDQAYVAAQQQLDAARAAGAAADAYVKACWERRAKARARITAPDLFERADLVRARLAELQDTKLPAPTGSVRRPDLLRAEQEARLEQNIAAFETQIANAPRPTQMEFDIATPAARQEYREAEAAYVEATKGTHSTRDPVRDAEHVVREARQLALGKVRRRLERIYGRAVRSQATIGRVMKDASSLTHAIAGRINALSANSVTNLCFPFFAPTTGETDTPFDAWLANLHQHVNVDDDE